jgi:hypothetical protein
MRGGFNRYIGSGAGETRRCLLISEGPHSLSYDDVMVSVLTLSMVDRKFELRSGQTKDYAIGMCCFFAKHTSLRRKNKAGWLGNRIMCPSGATCLSANCCFSDLVL